MSNVNGRPLHVNVLVVPDHWNLELAKKSDRLCSSFSFRFVNNILKLAHLCPVNGTLLPTASVTISEMVLIKDTSDMPPSTN